jgi:branched-subunit amino acid aminotransferase/4-amino-4-deoxychorismate lyase
MSENAFQIFTSLRYDRELCDVPESDLQFAGWNYRNKSPLYMLDFHRDRLLKAAKHWRWNKAIDVLEGEPGLLKLSSLILGQVKCEEDGPLRVRITLSQEGKLGCETWPVPKKSLQNLFPKELPAPGVPKSEGVPSREEVHEVVIDHGKTSRSEYTHFKTTRRGVYDTARQRAGIRPGDLREVLIVNRDNGCVMEGSISTPYFWRNGRWVTPPVPSQFSSEEGSGGNDGTTRRWALTR